MMPAQKGPGLCNQPQAPFKDASPGRKKLSRRTAKRKKKQGRLAARDRGTSQTRRRQAKVRENTLVRLMRERRKQGHTDMADIGRAAREIQNVFASRVRALSIRSSNLERVDCGNVPAEAPEWLEIAHSDRYLPWLRLLDEEMDCPAFEIIRDAIVFNITLGELDCRYKRRKGYSRHFVIRGLKLYAGLMQRG